MNKGKKIEILAPAGSPEALRAAVLSGTDAVYLGLKSFSARGKASNFSFDELKDAVEFCHSRGVKVYVAFNTLVYDDELSFAKEEIERICNTGADALILQDPGIISIALDCTNLRLHASTQMSAGTASGMKLLSKMGFERAVLPRELSKDEIEDIKSKTDIELELFVHGALCMCVSGQCYLSSVLGQRSGNRGLCAQPCRLPFYVDKKENYDLSLKDLSLIEEGRELSEMGISSLKIEGRMKRPEYVAAAVKSLDLSLKGERDEELKEKLRAVFSRSGFTKGYFQKTLGKSMFGTRKKEDVTAATGEVLDSLKKLYEREEGVFPVRFSFSMKEGEKAELTALSEGEYVKVFSNNFSEKAINKPLSEERLLERLSKCGGTQFYFDSADVKIDAGLILSAGEINAMRREALESLSKKISVSEERVFNNKKFLIPRYKAKMERKYNLRVSKLSQIPKELSRVEYLYVPLYLREEEFKNLLTLGVKIAVEIPRVIFGQEKKVKEALKRAKAAGINTALVSGIDSLALSKEEGFELRGGFGLNVTNSLSVLKLQEMGLKSFTPSFELTLQRVENLGGNIERELISYGRLPLMITRNCPVRNEKSCKECGSKSLLTDRTRAQFPVACGNGFSEILNSRPLYLADRLSEIKNVDYLTFYFTTEDEDEARKIIDLYENQSKADFPFTRGLYYRGAI